MKMTIWPMPSDETVDRVDGRTIDVIRYRIADEDNHPNHLHEFRVTGDDCGTVQLWLHDGGHLTKVWLDREMAEDMIAELRKAIDEAADFDPSL